MKTLYIKNKATFDYIKCGLKTIEVRLLKGFIYKLKPNMIINIEHNSQYIQLKIININKYNTFEELILNEGLSNILPTYQSLASLKDGLNILEKYYINSYNKYTIIAIKMCII